MGLSLSGDATLVGRLEAQETITNAISDWASAVGKFADVGKQLPGTMSELAGIGKGLPRNFTTTFGFDLSDDIIWFLPVAYGVVVGMVVLVTLIIVCSGNYRKFVDLKVRREEIALLREINRLEHAKAVQNRLSEGRSDLRRRAMDDSALLNNVVGDIHDKMMDSVPSAIVVEKPKKKDKSG
ncbi:hypothetical protein AAVH_25624 [Aphelenchoides avenae]|nr:hypothetical protein AAVH_25624 [Aphelenchus avenae]